MPQNSVLKGVRMHGVVWGGTTVGKELALLAQAPEFNPYREAETGRFPPRAR